MPVDQAGQGLAVGGRPRRGRGCSRRWSARGSRGRRRRCPPRTSRTASAGGRRARRHATPRVSASSSWSGAAAQLRLQPAGGLAQLVRQPAHVAREGVARAQVIEHGAADAVLGEGLEAIDPLGVVTLGGLHQADDARGDQVVDLDVSRQPAGQPASDLLDVGKKLSRVFAPTIGQRLPRQLRSPLRLLPLRAAVAFVGMVRAQTSTSSCQEEAL